MKITKWPVALFALLTGILRASDAPPNILLICIDDLNTEIGIFGGPAHTPHIDRLAKEGILFTDAHCTVPVCNASRVSFLTGLYANTTGVYSNHEHLRKTPSARNAVTLPQYFSKHGYTTVAAGKIFHSSRRENKRPHPLSDPQSWDFQYRNGIGVPYYTPENIKDNWHQGKLGDSYWPGKSYVWHPVDLPDEATDDWENADFCAQFLQKKHDKPFFLACGILRPHVPFTAPQKYFDRYPIETIKRPAILEDDLEDVGPIGKSWAHKADIHKWITHFDQWEKAIQGYRASTTYADACVGRLIDALNCSPYADNTIVVLLSDHGFHLGQKEHWAKFTFWDIGTHVPFIIKPINTPSGVCNETVSLIDLYPTLIELANLPGSDVLEGISLVPQLKNPSTIIDRPAHVHFVAPGNEAILNEQWRYIRYADSFEELYNRHEDPHDWNNLATLPEYASILQNFRTQSRFIEK